MGVQMDPVSILLLECFYACVCLREKGRGNRCLHVQECVCLFNTLVAGKAGSNQLYPVKASGMGGQGEKRDKSHRYSRKKKCIITLSQSLVMPVGQS